MPTLTHDQAVAYAAERLSLGATPEAIDILQQVLAQDPQHVGALQLLAEIARASGQNAAALALIQRALAVREDARLLDSLALIHAAEQRWPETIAALQRAVALDPGFMEAHLHLGIALVQGGRAAAATPSFEAAVRLQPQHPQALRFLAANHLALDRFAAALPVFERLAALLPADPEVLSDLGLCLHTCRRAEEAIRVLRECLRLAPDHTAAWINLGCALEQRLQIEPAIACYREAIARDPRSVEALNNLGSALKELGDVAGAVAHLRQAIALDPHRPEIHSNLVYLLHFHPDATPAEIGAEARAWAARHADPLRPASRRPPRPTTPPRRLRIGYVSPDFWDQAERFFVLPLLAQHDRQQFEIYLYASTARPDAITDRYRALADVWRDAVGLSHAQLAQQIEADEIDILVDLTMHMADHRLLTMARQPAPLQVSWLAYPGTTGLSAIDARISDAWMEPPGGGTCDSAEQPLLLPDCWCCYEPSIPSPDVSPLPALARGHLTFGSCNSYRKMNPAVLARWARLLHAVPDSRLLILVPGADAEARLRAQLADLGLDPARLECARPRPRFDYLSLYHGIDLALDPFPYNGITTTCDALWMGVPVLTLPGPVAASRAGASLLHTAGLPEFIATSEDDLIARALAWSRDLPRLAELRAGLRARVAASPLFDAARFTRHFEAALRTAWDARFPTASSSHS